MKYSMSCCCRVMDALYMRVLLLPDLRLSVCEKNSLWISDLGNYLFGVHLNSRICFPIYLSKSPIPIQNKE